VSDKVAEKIGRQYVKLVAEKLRDIEQKEAELTRKVAELLGTPFQELLETDIDRALKYVNELSYVLQLYREVHLRVQDLNSALARIAGD